MFCLCFLINESFPTKRVWERWLIEGAEHVCFVLHASNCPKHIYNDIETWCNKLCGHVVDPIPTAWCNINVVKAEGLMFDVALTKFPHASHFWLVSEKTIPCLSAQNMIKQLTTSKFKHSSCINPYLGAPLLDEVRTLFKSLEWNPKKGSQFLLLFADHWKTIRESFWNFVPSIEKYAWELECTNCTSLPPEEFLIQTILVTRISKKYIKPHCVVLDRFEPGALRARELHIGELCTAIRDASNRPPLVFGVRKITSITPSLMHLLDIEGVLTTRKGAEC
jgi:hypothetical protein